MCNSSIKLGMKIVFVILVLSCLTLARTTTNKDVTRKRKLLQLFYQNFPESSSAESHKQTQDDHKCYTIIGNMSCSSPYAQNYINGLAKCGDRATNDINNMISSCGRDKTGEYCGTFILTGSLDSCTGSSCSAACYRSLKQAGCCMNTTDQSYSQYLHLCGLPSPSPCNNSGLQIPNIPHDPTCTSAYDYAVTVLKTLCENIQPLIDPLRKNSCTDNLEYLMDNCSLRNGHYCFVELNITGGDSVGIQSLQKAGQNCPSDSSCSSQCKSSLAAVVNTIGCCFHIANITVSYDDGYGAVFSRSLWDTCGLQIPKQCSTPFIDAINTFKY